MKILRIKKDIHADFKELADKEKMTLNSAAEFVLKNAIKRGIIKETSQNAYAKLLELDKTFRSWMKYQEANFLKQISEEILSVSLNIKDFATKSDILHVLNSNFEIFRKENIALSIRFKELAEKQNTYKERIINQ